MSWRGWTWTQWCLERPGSDAPGSRGAAARACLEEWNPAGFTSKQAPAVHALLQSAYAHGGGTVAPFGPWWSALAADGEFDPALCFVAEDTDGALVGVAQCWTSAFVKDLAVHPLWQRRGIGRALMLQVFQSFRQRGAETVTLKVEAGNAAAIRFYQRLGMTVAGATAQQVGPIWDDRQR